MALAAVAKVTGQDALARIATSAGHEEVALAAVAKVTGQDALAKIARTASSRAVCEAACARILEDDDLVGVAMGQGSAAAFALERIASKSVQRETAEQLFERWNGAPSSVLGRGDRLSARVILARYRNMADGDVRRGTLDGLLPAALEREADKATRRGLLGEWLGLRGRVQREQDAVRRLLKSTSTEFGSQEAAREWLFGTLNAARPMDAEPLIELEAAMSEGDPRRHIPVLVSLIADPRRLGDIREAIRRAVDVHPDADFRAKWYTDARTPASELDHLPVLARMVFLGNRPAMSRIIKLIGPKRVQTSIAERSSRESCDRCKGEGTTYKTMRSKRSTQFDSGYPDPKDPYRYHTYKKECTTCGGSGTRLLVEVTKKRLTVDTATARRVDVSIERLRELNEEGEVVNYKYA